MEHSNFEIIISHFEEKITSIVEKKMLYYKYNSNPLLPLAISNDNNIKSRDFDVDATTFVTKNKEKNKDNQIRKLAKISPYIEKDLKKIEDYSDDLYCDMV
jgi:hypothetical protein